MNVCVLIPAFRPDDGLLELTGALIKNGFPVTVVDDGSGKEYSHIFSKLRDLGAFVLHHTNNKGKGAALKIGIRFIMSGREGFGGIVTADADGQHTVGDIGRMALALEAYPDTLILGRRDFREMPPRSRAGNTITRFLFRLSTGLKISDTQTGLRGLPACLYPKLLELPGDRYEYEMDMLLALGKWGISYLEIPIDTVYLDDNSSSHFHALRDGWRVLSRIIKYTLSSLCCAAADYLFYILLLAIFPAAWSYAAARVCSASLNYLINCKVVFGGKTSWKSAAGYALLALCSLSVGSVTVGLLTNLGVGEVLAKLCIDSCLFAANYLVQRHWIFK